jgi:hypothetical protein
MNDTIQVRLGRKRAANWKQFLKRTGLNQAELVRSAIDARMQSRMGGLPPTVARWAGKVEGRGITATNEAVARSLGR